MNGYNSQLGQSCCNHDATDPLYGTTAGMSSQAGTPPQMPPQSVSPYLMPPSRGQGAAAATPSGNLTPITPTTQPPAVTLQSTEYLNGYLRTIVGQNVRVEFLIGTNTYLDRSGKLLGVGANYILLQEAGSDDITVCDYYSIRFVTIIR